MQPLPPISYSPINPDQTNGQDECPICLMPWDDEQRILAHKDVTVKDKKENNYLHPLHEKCWESWKKINPVCPSCKKPEFIPLYKRAINQLRGVSESIRERPIHSGMAIAGAGISALAVGMVSLEGALFTEFDPDTFPVRNVVVASIIGSTVASIGAGLIQFAFLYNRLRSSLPVLETDSEEEDAPSNEDIASRFQDARTEHLMREINGLRFLLDTPNEEITDEMRVAMRQQLEELEASLNTRG